MFWRFGGYANISTLDTILDKPDVTLEELLDESDLIQELKQHNTKLIEYLRDENVLRRLLQYVVAPQASSYEEERNEDGAGKEAHDNVASESGGDFRSHTAEMDAEARDKKEKARLKYSYIATEVLSSETWSILEALMENRQHLREFWEFLRRPPPLDNTIAGYFTKINETLLDKKTEEMLEFFKSLDQIVLRMLRHVDCPVIMDLLLKIISLEKAEGGEGIVDWLQSQHLITSLLSFLEEDQSPATQTSAGDFLKAIITISANASQNEHSCIGPNDMTRDLVSGTAIESLISNMLRGGNPLTVGVGIIIEVIRKNNSDYDPDVGAGADSVPSSRDPIYLGTLLRKFAKHVPDFMELILSPNHRVSSGTGTKVVRREPLKATFGEKIEPLGFDRFKTCELMAELLHCSNMGLLNERGSESYVKQRDQERERLKAEGGMPHAPEESQSGADYTEIDAGFNNQNSSSVLESGSIEEIRRLEVANGGEDDEFEDVGASGILSEDVDHDSSKDSAFRTRSRENGANALKSEGKPRLDLGDEFVDEPLSSPRLNVERPDEVVEVDLPSTSPKGSIGDHLSSTSSALTQKVGGLDLDHDIVMTSPPPSDSAYEEVELEPTDNSVTASTDPGIKSNKLAPPLPQRDQHHELDLAHDSGQGDLSPHPDDKPAPLFAARLEQQVQHDKAGAKLDEHDVGAGNSSETIDTTQGEEGDSVKSILLSGNEQDFEPHVETDVDGQPVVGDYLKMMFVEHRVVPTILDFFFRFPWNNFLHNVVYDVVQQVFNGPMDRGYNRSLAIDLFETGRITEHIVEGQRRSDEAQEKNKMRLGYMGHLTLVAEEVVKFSERNPTHILPQSVLDKVMRKQWIHYVEHTLSETRERDNAILGGVRPDMSVGPRQAVINAVNAAQGFGNGGSSALANAGLNGGAQGLDGIDLANNGSASSGAFGISGGSLLSGFGSSSDEEDEEMEDGDEHEGAARAGSDQLSTYISSSLLALDTFSTNSTNTSSSNSSSTPLGPPPPPPLNIPPSRARRQLAARLALQKQKQAQAQAQPAALSADNHHVKTDASSSTGADSTLDSSPPTLYSEPSSESSLDVTMHPPPSTSPFSFPGPSSHHAQDDRTDSTAKASAPSSFLFAPAANSSSSSSSSSSSDGDSDDDGNGDNAKHDANPTDEHAALQVVGSPEHTATTSSSSSSTPVNNKSITTSTETQSSTTTSPSKPDAPGNNGTPSSSSNRRRHRSSRRRRGRRPSTTEATTRQALELDDEEDDGDAADGDGDGGGPRASSAVDKDGTLGPGAGETSVGAGGLVSGGKVEVGAENGGGTGTAGDEGEAEEEEEDDGIVEIKKPRRGELLLSAGSLGGG